MIDKILEALKDWRFYIVFITFFIFILILDKDTITYFFDKIGGVFHG